MTPTWPRFLPMGDRGVLVEYAPEVSPEVNALVRGADAVLARFPGVVEVVPAFRSVLVVYDPLDVSYATLAERVETAVRATAPAPDEGGRLVEIPVAYGGVYGPDLEAVASACGLSADDVIRLHTSVPYRAYMLGFSPGFPYLGLLPSHLRVPRRATPRTRIPPGSVAVADRFTGVYPQDTAGGWHLLGRTPLRVFDPAADPPCLLQPGDRVRFVPIEGATVFADPTAPPARAGARPAMEVLRPGLLTTIQDLGRRGWRRLGIPGSGAMDRGALQAANEVVGNDPRAAAIELAFPGPVLRAAADVDVAVGGADFDARLNAAALDPLTAARMRPGDLLTFRTPRRGQWAYVAVTGGIDAPLAFGSRSTYARGGLGGIEGRALRAGDVLGAGEATRARGTVQHAYIATPPTGPLRVVLGPQADRFPADAQAAILGQPFEVTMQRDRSGMRIRGPRLAHRGEAEILSDGVLPGAIQVPADGSPVITLVDGPTIGGYPKLASVVAADLDRLVQYGPGDRLRFEAVTVAHAHELLREHVIGWGPSRS